MNSFCFHKQRFFSYPLSTDVNKGELYDIKTVRILIVQDKSAYAIKDKEQTNYNTHWPDWPTMNASVNQRTDYKKPKIGREEPIYRFRDKKNLDYALDRKAMLI